MAVLPFNNPTWLDFVALMDPSGNIMPVAEVLNLQNEMLAEMSFIEGNLPIGHQYSIRTGIPMGTWRAFYNVVQDTKATTQKVTETCGNLEAYCTVDAQEAEINGNTDAFFMTQAVAHLEGMAQQAQTAVIYGNVGVNPEQIHGLAPRYSSRSANNGDNIIHGGGAGSDNRSIWLIVWGPTTCTGIIPKGTTAGIKKSPVENIRLQSYNGVAGYMEAKQQHFQQYLGLGLPDWRYVVRIANIDRSSLTADASSGANLSNLMFDALERIPNLSAGRAAFYMTRTEHTFLRKQMSNAVSGSTLTFEDVGGRKNTPMFQGVPIRRTDALEVDEAVVV